VGVRTLIVDDEPLCRERVRSLLAPWPQIDIVGECAFAADAIRMLATHDLDLLLLDIQLPDASGFEVIERAGVDRTPLVIFVTAFADYAVDAFEVHALDYLLKPIERERFDRAVGRALAELDEPEKASRRERLDGLLRTVRSESSGDVERLLVRSGPRLVFVRACDVDWFEANGNYVGVHVGRETHLMRQTMARLEARLDPTRFARIHRRALVNLDALRELRRDDLGECVAVLRNGERLPVSRRCRQRIEAAFENGLR
jgi:two-component system, LytTR family, response regulator